MTDQPTFEPNILISGIKPLCVPAGTAVDIALTIIAAIALPLLFLETGAFELDQPAFSDHLDDVMNGVGFAASLLAVSSLATVVGAYIAARRANIVHIKHGVWVVVLGLFIVFLLPADDSAPSAPLWFDVASWLLVFPCGILGGYLARLRANVA